MIGIQFTIGIKVIVGYNWNDPIFNLLVNCIPYTSYYLFDELLYIFIYMELLI